MDKQSVKKLIERYLAGNCTLEEKALIERFYMEEVEKRKLPDHIGDPLHAKDAMWKAIAAQTNPKQDYDNKQNDHKEGSLVFYRSTSTFYRSIAAAAAIIIAIGIGLYFYPQRSNKTLLIAKASKQIDISPGGNKATLTLSNGQQIALTETPDGILANQAGVAIKKTKNGQLVYSSNREHAPNDSLIFNTISTPKGGQYQVILPDGTSVWLNAASTLRFPARFKGNERKVSLTGEGYFEVAKNKKMPFRVVTGRQVTEVLGTHFNINSYADEAHTKTTLLEGSVKVVSLFKPAGPDHKTSNFPSVILKPGEQSVLAGDLTVIKADLLEVMAWRSNRLTFNSQPLENIMRQVSRWYNVEIEYRGDISEKAFTGTVSRYANVSQVLKMLEFTNLVHFKIEGRRIIVMP